MTEKKLNMVLASFVFIFSLIVYLLTMAPTVSFWDCGEFIACSFRLAVPHPPGAPYYLLLGRIFSMIPLFENIAARVNFISVLASATTVLLLYLTIVHFAKKMFNKESYTFFDLTGIYSGATIGSLIFAFTHSFWFNAVEAEVYALSMLFTALVVYLVLLWEHHADEEGNERYLLMIAYLVGLALGVHMLNVLALPFVFLIVYFRKYNGNFGSFVKFMIGAGILFILIYPGIVYGIPKIALNFNFFGLFVFVLFVLVAFVYIRKSFQGVALVLLSMLLILIGYSTYATIYIRSNLDPNIDENNPETIEKFVSYLEREQYGEHTLNRTKQWQQSPNGKRYKSAGEFFWKYQINYMYNRYFLWQFLGMAEDEESVDPTRFFYLPLLLGLFGLFYQSMHDKKNAFSTFVLFFMTGYAIILYLNQPDPQPRERDYSYVGSFFAFAIWIGLGLPAIFQMLKEKIGENKVVASVIVLLGIFTPVNMLAKEFHRHSRAGNYLAWDYSYNLLNSCEPNGILITNGDNDTFPLWYLQEVEGIRTDVRVVNLSLLNTSWYIQQLKDLEPKVPISLSDQVIAQIEQLPYRPWKEQVIKINVPKDLQKAEYLQKVEQMKVLYPVESIPVDTAGTISFKVKPKLMNYSLRVQDYMFMHILQQSKWQRPIYVSLTVSDDNQLDELRNYRRVDGLVYKITTQRGWDMNPEMMYKNIMEKYKFRGLNDESVFIPMEHRSLVSNYRNVIYKLNEYFLRSNQLEKSKELISKFVENVDLERFPVYQWQARMWEMLNIVAAGVWGADSLISYTEDLARQQNVSNEILIEEGVMYNINQAYFTSPYFSAYYEKLFEKYAENKPAMQKISQYYNEYLTKRSLPKEEIEHILSKIKEQYPLLNDAANGK
ncbi:MAG: DUF2723 domain-containing protein [Calditrichia bacterium]